MSALKNCLPHLSGLHDSDEKPTVMQTFLSLRKDVLIIAFKMFLCLSLYELSLDFNLAWIYVELSYLVFIQVCESVYFIYLELTYLVFVQFHESIYFTRSGKCSAIFFFKYFSNLVIFLISSVTQMTKIFIFGYSPTGL